MFAERYFPDRMFARRYFPALGADVVSSDAIGELTTEDGALRYLAGAAAFDTLGGSQAASTIGGALSTNTLGGALS